MYSTSLYFIDFLIDLLTQKHNNTVYKECAIEKIRLSAIFKPVKIHPQIILELSVKKKKKHVLKKKCNYYQSLLVYFCSVCLISAHLKVWAEHSNNGTEWNLHVSHCLWLLMPIRIPLMLRWEKFISC